MACASKTFRIMRSVWTDGTTAPIYHSFLRVPIADWSKARVSLLMEGSSGNLTVATGVMYGNDEAAFAGDIDVDFGAPTTLGGDGSAYGVAFTTFDTAKQLVDLGVRARNTGVGTKIEQARVTLVVDVGE